MFVVTPDQRTDPFGTETSRPAEHRFEVTNSKDFPIGSLAVKVNGTIPFYKP